MKICHVITRMIIGGAQENTLLSMRGAIESGHDVTLVTGPTDGPEGKLLQEQPLPGLKIVVCPDLIRSISPLKDLAAIRFLKKFFREQQFDVVHTHTSKAGIVGRYAARKAGVPLVVHTVHGLAFHPFQSKWKNQLYIACEKFAAKYCDRIECVAQAMIDQCLAAGIGRPEQFKVVYSGMELEPFLNSTPDPALRQKLGIPEGAVVFTTLARLFPQKGYEDFIPAAKSLAAKRQDVHFLLIGGGILTEPIQKELEQAHLSDRFSFAGLIPPSEVHRYLAISDILVHLSLHEGLPRAAVQALACKKPVIAFDLDGTPEVVLDGKTGYLTRPRDREMVERAMTRLADFPELCQQFGEAGRELVSGRFGWKLMADTILEDYRTCLKELQEQKQK